MREWGRYVIESVRATGEFDNRAFAEMQRQALALAEECGEFVGAYRRATRQARRDGTWREVAYELADVVTQAFTTAESLGIDLDLAIAEKMEIINARGWKDQEVKQAP